MSHFTVAVITDSKPTHDDIAAILQPWHEFECTGIDDQYVLDVDRTEEAMADYAKATVTLIKGPDGVLHHRFDEKGEWKPEFSKPGEYGRREGVVPPGYELVEAPASDTKSAAKWISDYYGWAIAGQDDSERLKYGFIELAADGSVARCIDRTNPNKKWDWWQIGGRWTGMLKMKQPEMAVVGKAAWCADPAEAGHGDMAQKSDIDIEGVRAKASADARILWDKVDAIVSPLPAFETWDACRERIKAIDEARAFYWEQPAVAALKRSFPDSWGLDQEIKAATMTREAFAAHETAKSFTTFAFIKDGEWVEKGEMGWFACVRDEKDQDDWSSAYAKMIDSLPDTAWITVVDCHI